MQGGAALMRTLGPRFAVPTVGALALLAACGGVDTEGADPSPDVSIAALVQEPPRACPAKPARPGQCGMGSHQGTNTGTNTGGSPRVDKITVAGCTGVDDTALIQDALDRADEVHLPAGTCAVSGLVVQKKPIKLMGKGRDRTTLRYIPRAQDNCVFASLGAHTIIMDLAIDGSGLVGGIFIRPKSCVGPVLITRVDVRNAGGHGIVVSGDGTGSVNGVNDTETGVGADPVVIIGNTVASLNAGIYVATTSIPNIKNVQIRENRVQAQHEAGISVRGLFKAAVAKNETSGGEIGVQLESGGQDVTIADNDVAGASVAGLSLGGGALNSGTAIEVARNHVTGCAAGAVVGHMSAGRFQNVTITANDFSNNTILGLEITAGQAIVVSRNLLSGNGLADMEILTAPVVSCPSGDRCTAIDDLHISDNLFRVAGGTTKAGLYVDNTTARAVSVAGNDLRYDAPTPPYQPVAVINAPAPGELTFDGNQGWPAVAPAP
jgi:hypothetical protein